MLGRKRLALCAVLFAVAAMWGWIHGDTLLSIFRTWDTNATFSHGFLIVPISLWLLWRKRAELATVPWRSAWLGVACLLACSAAWVVGRGVGALAVEQFAVVAMVPTLVLAVTGAALVRVLAMPLAYLMLAVPVGYALVPWLMHSTADVATWALKLTGVPVLRSDMYISVPNGKFEVARACSGLNYVVTGLALGALYSYLTYSGWRKRLISMFAFVVIPILANGLRVYFTILVSYLTNMRFGPGDEHVWFGRVFFIMVVFVMMGVGRRWHDEGGPGGAASVVAVPQPRLPLVAWLPVFGASLALIAGPLYLRSALASVEGRLGQEQDRLQLVPGDDGWTGPWAGAEAWRPQFVGARVERAGVYRDAAGAAVDAYVGVYGIGTSGGAEMISYQNRVFAQEHFSLGDDHLRTVSVAGGDALTVREARVDDAYGRHLVWYWFMVGDRHLTDRYVVKAYEALAFVDRGAVTERVVTLSTPIDGDEVARLERFVEAHGGCVAAGFAYEACGG